MNQKHSVRDYTKFFFIGFLVFAGALAWATILSGDNICDTPFGAQDLRCVGHFEHRR